MTQPTNVMMIAEIEHIAFQTDVMFATLISLLLEKKVFTPSELESMKKIVVPGVEKHYKFLMGKK